MYRGNREIDARQDKTERDRDIRLPRTQTSAVLGRGANETEHGPIWKEVY